MNRCQLIVSHLKMLEVCTSRQLIRDLRTSSSSLFQTLCSHLLKLRIIELQPRHLCHLLHIVREAIALVVECTGEI